jgi:hypothetical protein
MVTAGCCRERSASSEPAPPGEEDAAEEPEAEVEANEEVEAKVEEVEAKVEEEVEAEELTEEEQMVALVRAKAAELLESWATLQDVFRIPKKERQVKTNSIWICADRKADL